MSEVVLLDTSIFLNVLDVPGRNQDRISVLEQFGRKIENGDHFLLPMATIWETGNHISKLASGAARRQFAQVFVSNVSNAFGGITPYRATHFPERSEFSSWLDTFPDYAMRNKSENKPNEGVSLADMSIIKEWERTVTQNPSRVVGIWSLDIDLSGYRSEPKV